MKLLILSTYSKPVQGNIKENSIVYLRVSYTQKMHIKQGIKAPNVRQTKKIVHEFQVCKQGNKAERLIYFIYRCAGAY